MPKWAMDFARLWSKDLAQAVNGLGRTWTQTCDVTSLAGPGVGGSTWKLSGLVNSEAVPVTQFVTGWQQLHGLHP